ncbi:Hypothetical_protein [Hexamita inflata]|uniref:Hypothetical_protein n=1 Tax=Hexamita inflata TaxID=28002 RepID=A0AA86NA20_9EUKA|nr:Hypothetical protein HINF_LOCUS3101 [Hexamita inflata]
MSKYNKYQSKPPAQSQNYNFQNNKPNGMAPQNNQSGNRFNNLANNQNQYNNNQNPNQQQQGFNQPGFTQNQNQGFNQNGQNRPQNNNGNWNNNRNQNQPQNTQQKQPDRWAAATAVEQKPFQVETKSSGWLSSTVADNNFKAVNYQPTNQFQNQQVVGQDDLTKRYEECQKNLKSFQDGGEWKNCLFGPFQL